MNVRERNRITWMNRGIREDKKICEKLHKNSICKECGNTYFEKCDCDKIQP